MSLDTELVIRESLQRDCYRLYPSQIKFLKDLAVEQKTSQADILRDIINRFQKLHFHRKGLFICQSCGKERRNKECHQVRVEEEVFLFGDCCFFNDMYKKIIQQLFTPSN